jgi:hypothetical protein
VLLWLTVNTNRAGKQAAIGPGALPALAVALFVGIVWAKANWPKQKVEEINLRPTVKNHSLL